MNYTTYMLIAPDQVLNTARFDLIFDVPDDQGQMSEVAYSADNRYERLTVRSTGRVTYAELRTVSSVHERRSEAVRNASRRHTI